MKNINRIYSFTVTVLIFVFVTSHVFAQNKNDINARVQLNMAMRYYAKSHNWKSEKIATPLKKIIEKYPRSSDFLTAKLLYACHLLSFGNPAYFSEGSKFCIEIIKTSPQSWQSVMARFYLTALYGMQGNYHKEIICSKKALSEIDFGALKKNKDKDLLFLLKATSSKVSDIEDGFRVFLSNAYLETGEIKKAQKVLIKINNRKLKDLIFDAIKRKKNDIKKHIP